MPSQARINELLLRIAGQQSGAGAVPREEMAIVSPCSKCQNYQKSNDTSDPYRNSCPRRIWIDANSQGLIDIDPVLYTSGTSDPHTLTNPVVDPASHNYLVWVAAVDDNAGVIDENGNPLTPGILSPEFNNLYIRCRPHPYVPEDIHSLVKLSGHLQENDKVWATGNRHSSIDPFDSSKTVPVAGTVVKGTFASGFNTTNPSDHLQVPG